MIKKLALIFILLSATIAIGRSHSSSSRSSSSKSYSSGSSSSGSSSKSYSSGSSGRSYSSGKSSKAIGAAAAVGTAAVVYSSSSKADKAQAKAESKSSFNAYKASQIQAKYKANPESYNYLKSQPKEVYTSRSARQDTVFHNYRNNQQPTVVYQDRGWNPFFWLWLMDRPNQQAEWVYHHRSELSDERYKDLLAKNKDLEGQLKALEDKKLPKDSNFAPKEIDKDLMYSDEMAKESQEKENDYSWIWWLMGTPIILGTVGYGVYAIFFKKRNFI